MHALSGDSETRTRIGPEEGSWARWRALRAISERTAFPAVAITRKSTPAAPRPRGPRAGDNVRIVFCRVRWPSEPLLCNGPGFFSS
jgi:hypothetical protein